MIKIDLEKLDGLERVSSKDLGEGIRLIIGSNNNEDVVQSIEFEEPRWTNETAQKWIEDHSDQLRRSHEDGKSIAAVEVFAAGEWNGDYYSTDDLDEMVKAYEENKQTLKPALKLGHDEEQKLLQRDGYPAAGWVENLRRVGDKLVADFKQVPSKIYDAIKKGAYKKVSSEIYWDIKLGEKSYKRFLSAVSLLGVDLPAVSSLSDILQLYRLESFKTYADKESIVKTYQHQPKKDVVMAKTEKEIELELKLQELSKNLQAKETELKEFSHQQAKLKEYENKLQKLELENQIDKIEGMTASIKPYALALLGEKKKTYEFEDKKQMSAAEVLQEIMKLIKATAGVNMAEETEEPETKSEMQAQESAINEYMTKNKVSYTQAYKAVLRGAN